MLPQTRLAQLAEMEKILNEANEFLTEAETFLAKWQAFLPKMQRLEHYYFEGDWREDFEAYEKGEIPNSQPCGVLSEDLIFNASAEQQSLAIDYLKVITEILDQRNR
ncbi:DUF4298 domain-containing protein [Rodentibacter caecimuris]|uniref:DUF4298 domain-containing protein n=1 Tax=Rodentibacter caecimuris TaxID=1796644 RepID=UPI0013A0972B|nr:DUF4298 domain-containing protein [Rodentibacter heylii]MCQ9123651.1 DUF4298 domain-containing protein [Rodentibacter heylii]MCX2961302.1 DUF4298 domain-containing protein [Rodentibacter heylii]QIA77138.1 DUF4298 domain-containing protein [Rodentibacter heylii]